MARADADGEIRAILEEVVAGLRLELVEVEWAGKRGRRTMRAYIDRPGGVALSDCAAVSRALGERLEEGGVSADAYRLEVSSPGVERRLQRMRDFERSLGRRVRICFRDKRGERTRIVGEVVEAEGDVVRVVERNGESVSFSLADVAKANLDVDWEAEFRGQGDAG